MTIQGEARNSKAVLELPTRLRSNPAIAEARVVSQSPASNSEARDFPVRFATTLPVGQDYPGWRPVDGVQLVEILNP